MVVLILLTFLLSTVLCAEYRISDFQGFVSFTSSVNTGTSFSGTTVFLGTDIDFAGQSSKFVQIGTYSDRAFAGEFDGQGHTISNAVITSSLQSLGLFGITSRITVKNVVVDKSCSFVSSFSTENYSPFIGGILGRCSSSQGSCRFENCVNMASLSFEGNATRNIFIGGIVGSFYTSSDYLLSIKNCVNYGSLTHSGTGGSWVELGGIAGLSQGETIPTIFIQNCLNYGAIINSGISKSLAIGGIVGVSIYTKIDNCFSSGTITTNKESSYIGGIVGSVSKSTEITHCYWSEAMNREMIGYIGSMAMLSNNSAFDPTSLELTDPVTVGSYTGSSLTKALNAAADKYTLRDYSHWLLNKQGSTVSFTINGNKMKTTMTSCIILLPALASVGSSVFDGWYTDAACKTPLAKYEAVSNLGLYGLFKEDTQSYTIAFDTRGGTPSVAAVTKPFGSVVTLSSGVKRDNCEFLGWETAGGDSVSNSFSVPAQDITLYASWLCTRITTPEELVAFSKVVGKKRSFSGKTIFLDSDLDFAGYSERSVQMGYDSSNYFNGTFDGQGHVISNLAIESALYTGLFGYSEGTTVKGVVVDESCSFVGSLKPSSPYVGGIFGRCYSSKGSCVVENCVNMGSVSFKGDATGNAFIGGVVGCLYFSEYPTSIKNCVNYGSVTHSGTSGNWLELGGIGWYCWSHSSKINCTNYYCPELSQLWDPLTHWDIEKSCDWWNC